MRRKRLPLGCVLLLLFSTPLLAQTSADRLAQAVAAREAGQHEEAIRLYKTLVDDPDQSVRALALEGAALLLSWQGDYAEAIEDYRLVAKLSPEKRRDAIYGAARTLGWARRHKEGLHELQPLIDENPDDKEVRMLEAQIAGWGGFTARSMAAFRRVLQLDPAHREARLGLAKVLSWGGRLAESEKEYEHLLKDTPDYDDALIGLSYTLLWQGRPHEAKEHFSRVSKAAQANKEYRILQVAVEWGLMERADAVAHRRILTREMPGEPDVRDHWRAQAGVLGHNLRGDSTRLSDNEGLDVTTASLGGSARVTNAGFVFGDFRKEWLDQEPVAFGFPVDSVEVKGGRAGLDWAFGHVALRGSLGSRTSDVDTGGTVGGLTLTTLVRPSLALSAGLDSDFMFVTPQAVRNDVRTTGLNLRASSSLGSRLGVAAGYSRNHFEGPEGRFRLTSPAASARLSVDQNRDLLNGSLRYQAGGFGGDYGNVRVDVGARGLWFRFDRQFPSVGYWNPRSFRQVMGLLGATYRKGEELSVIANVSLGLQRQDDADWETAAYVYAEALKQLGRRWDAWARADYANSGLTRRTGAGSGYRAWSAAAGLLVRLGDRSPAAKPKGEPLSPHK